VSTRILHGDIMYLDDRLPTKTPKQAQGVSASHQSLAVLEFMVCILRSHRFVSCVTEALLVVNILLEVVNGIRLIDIPTNLIS
jgi:hypothetical protein